MWSTTKKDEGIVKTDPCPQIQKPETKTVAENWVSNKQSFFVLILTTA